MTASRLNGVHLAILSSQFDGVCRKMGNTLLRTGRSGVLNRARDFSCCIVTAAGDLLATAESLPIHVLSGPDLMARSMLEFFPELRPGDAFLHNSPYHGCSHAADHSLLVPVFDDDGVHRYTVITKAHQADIGNSVPTTYFGSARDVYEEGALIFPCVQVQRDYAVIDDIVRMCEMRIRVPEQWYGDFLALLAAARIGERELRALGADHGWDRLGAFAEDWFAYSEQRMAAAIGALPAGTVSASATHDPIEGTPDDGVTIKATVTVSPDEGIIEVDVRDNPDSLSCGLNLSEACARTAVLIGVFNSVDESVPKNAGAFRRVTAHLREGCVVGIPRHPTSCSAATTNLADRLACAVQLAFAELGDGFGMAEVGPSACPSDAVISGVDPRTGGRFVNQLFLGHTCGAASPVSDGWLTFCHVGNAGMSYVDSIELDEIYHPILVTRRSLIPDSEGAGRFRGAPGLEVEYKPRGMAMEVSYVSDGSRNAAQGANGGLRGAPAAQFRRRQDGRLEPLPACALVTIRDGESVVSYCSGGGGYGDPRERDRGRVRHDFEEGYITADRARDVYGLEP